jgi:hypothetical protein
MAGHAAAAKMAESGQSGNGEEPKPELAAVNAP